MKLIFAAAGSDRDDRTGCLAELRTIAVTQHLKFRDRFDRRIKKNSAVRTGVVVVCTVRQEKVALCRVSVHRKIDAGEQALVLAIEIILRSNARHKLGKLHKAAAIEGKFANLLPIDNLADRTRLCLN